MALFIVNSSKNIDNKDIKVAAEKIFNVLGKDFDVGLKFVTEEEIKNLNLIFRGVNKSTNVLSFDSDEPKKGGDIVICDDVIEKESASLSISSRDLVVFYLVHGILHLAGFDHKRPQDRVKMEKKEKEIAAVLGLGIER